MEFVALIIANGPEIISALFAIHAAALAIVNLTPTPKDNEVVNKYYRVIEVLAGVVTKVSKQ
tara:strand:- start:122 stop:307 length:186 start_codon:yes stop_codon:yes gene_type:complete